MINLNKYNDLNGYLQDQNRPVDECAVSQIAQSVKYDGVNVILTAAQLPEKSVCAEFVDTYTNESVFIPIETLDLDVLDTDRYTIKQHAVFGVCNGRVLRISPSQQSGMWAQNNYYKLYCDTSEDGGFEWAITINGTAKGGQVVWESGEDISDIVYRLNREAVANRLIFKALTDEDDIKFVGITVNNYSNSTFTISNDTGTMLKDLSEKCYIDGVEQSQVHRQWQGVAVKTLFPQFPGPNPSTTLYGRNKLNMSYRAGGNLAKYKQYYRGSNGSATYVAEANGRMSEQGFANLNGSDNPAAQALYDKYNGSWDAYMEAGMIWVDSTYRSSMEFLSYDNGKECNDFLASITTVDLEGKAVPAYPAAAAAASSNINGENGCLPTIHELALIMDVDNMARINDVFSALSGATKLSNSSYVWSVAECNANTAWFYYGGYGGVYGSAFKYASNSVRPVLASNA